jgi:hypothetical protein
LGVGGLATQANPWTPESADFERQRLKSDAESMNFCWDTAPPLSAFPPAFAPSDQKTPKHKT